MKKYELVCLSIILFAIFSVNVRFLNMKSGYYVDEGMTLFLANGHYNGAVTSKSESGLEDFIETYVIKEGDGPIQVIQNVWGMLSELVHAGNYSSEGTVKWYDDARHMLQGNTQWISGETLFREMVAEKGDRFRYAQVYLNQIMDVHPCFYYILVHTVFSIFSGLYSDAFLFGINILFLMMTCLVMYYMVKEYLKDERAAFLSVVIFGFSQGFASCAIYFRMYAVLTFFIMLTLYMHFRFLIVGRNVVDKGKMTGLSVTVLLGFNTHYYYILFLFSLFLLTCVWIRKRRVLLGCYVKSMIRAGIVSLFVWPFSIYHIFFGYRGTEAVSNIISDGFLKRLYSYVSELGSAFTLNASWAGILLVLISVLSCIVVWNKEEENRCVILSIAIPCVVYLTFIAQIAPTISDRYIMCLLPCISIFISLAISKIIALLNNKRTQTIVLSVFGIVYSLFDVCLAVPNYLYLEQRGKELAIQGNKEEYHCVMLGFDHGQGFPVALKLSEFDQVLVAGRLEIDCVIAPEHVDKGIVVYIYEGLEVSECLKALEKNMGLNVAYVELDSDIAGFEAFVYE